MSPTTANLWDHSCPLPTTLPPDAPAEEVVKWRCPECGQRWRLGRGIGGTHGHGVGKPSVLWEARRRAQVKRIEKRLQEESR